MKRILPLIVALTGAATAAGAAVESQELKSAYAVSISANGRWMLSQADGEGYLIIRDLVSGTDYRAGGNLTADGTGYTAGLGTCIADDGTAICLINGIPHYWTPRTLEWTRLKGEAQDGSAAVGSITPDGSVIVGSIGASGSTTDDVMMTTPCIWRRRAGGSYDDPVYLPAPSKDPQGMVPQYVNLISVSDDGNVIAALMTVWSGFYDIPYIYTRGADGSWSYSDVGSALIPAMRSDIPRNPGAFSMTQPDAWQFLDEEQTRAFWEGFAGWSTQEPQCNLIDEDFTVLQLRYMADFMNEADREAFLKEWEKYYEAYLDWKERTKAYDDYRSTVEADGMNFLRGNARVTPDGKYAVFTAESTYVVAPELGEDGITVECSPVMFDTATGEPTFLDSDQSLVMTSVAGDYSVICRSMGPDAYWPDQGWIFPGGGPEAVALPEYIRAKGSPAAYTWMEENMYRECMVGVDEATGNIRYDDRWTVGNVYCTPDLGVLACANSTMYWADSAYTNISFVSFVLVTGIDAADSGVDGMVPETADVFNEVFTLTGIRVWAGAGIPGLPSGIYIVKSTDGAGASSTRKVIL